MRGRSFPWMVALAMLIGVPAATRADDAGVRKALQANYDRIAAAFRAHKPQVMDSILTPNATLTTPDHQTWNRARIVSDFGRQSTMMKDATWSRHVVSVAVHKNEAVATIKGKFHGAFTDREGKPHVFDSDTLTVDTWIRSGNTWKLKHVEARDLKPKIDGKPLPTGMGGHR